MALLRTAHSSFGVALGDLPTWALFLGAFAAALIALRQLRIQQEDSARQTHQLERQQAEKVNHSWYPATSVQILSQPPARIGAENWTMVVVSNTSPRPIRDVTSRIELADGTTLNPIMFGVAVPLGMDERYDYRLYDPRQGTRVLLIRAENSYGFIFEYTIPDHDATHPEARTAHPLIRFTDDVGLSWEIDDDLHLEQIRPAPQLWQGLLPPDPL